MLEIKSLSKSFGGKTALENIDIEFVIGRIYGVVGYSGAGKSTLVRCLNLLEKPDTGQVIYNGENIVNFDNARLQSVRRDMAMIFQHFNLFNAKTVYQNVETAMANTTRDKQATKAKVLELLEQVGMLEYQDQYPSRLSGGQKQRVAIARALATNPKILLCDEATSALDPKSTHEILDLLKRLNVELGLTIIVITHEMNVVKEICQQIIFLEKGKVVVQGGLVDLLNNPKTRSFINSDSNLEKFDQIKDQLGLFSDDLVYEFTFKDKAVNAPYINTLIRDYDLDITILLGDIKLFNGVPFGGLIVKVAGTNQNIEAGLAYLESQGIHSERKVLT